MGNLGTHPKHFVPCICVPNIEGRFVNGSYQDEDSWENQQRKRPRPLPKSPPKSQAKKRTTENRSLFEFLPKQPLLSETDSEEAFLGPLVVPTFTDL